MIQPRRTLHDEVVRRHVMTSNTHNITPLSLDQQREIFSQRRFLATPLAGTIAWTIAGFAGHFLSEFHAVLTLFIATGCIVYLAMFIARFTGEDFFQKGKPKNTFDNLFCVLSPAHF
jgi:hypothetical protein